MSVDSNVRTTVHGRMANGLRSRGLRHLFDMLLAWQERAETARHLREMDEDRLRDVGLTRRQADAEARRLMRGS